MLVYQRHLIAACLLAALSASSALARKHDTGFLDRTVTMQGMVYKYQVFVPENWSSQQKWPVILALHGAGESGDDGLVETEVGLAVAIRRDRSHFPALVVFPQCRQRTWWLNEPMPSVAMAALEATSKEFHGDPSRTYLTGLSMGGYGAWFLAERYPGRFAAVVPICGGILPHPEESSKQTNPDLAPYVEAAKKIGAQTPVWIFHGSEDDQVPVTESRRMDVAMRTLGGEVHYTEYVGVKHDSWDRAYADETLIAWMLSKFLSGNTNR
jgi:predicted peptidase